MGYDTGVVANERDQGAGAESSLAKISYQSNKGCDQKHGTVSEDGQVDGENKSR